jgi:molybdenum cofactor synthesis domain-containing protein
MDLRVAIITISDRSFQGKRKDASGPLLKRLAEKKLGTVIHGTIIPDEIAIITGALINCADNLGADIILTTGGTGVSSRDVTPEATAAVIEREMPGFSEVLRMKGFDHTPMSLLSRAKAGIRGKSVIVNFPGNPRAIEQSFDFLVPALKHCIEILKGISSE